MTLHRLPWLLAAIISFLLPGPAIAGATVKLTKAECKWLVEHRPRDDVAYREGVDVRGRAVVPADLPGAPDLALPEDYVFDIEVRPFDFVERRHLTEDGDIIADALSENATTLNLGTAEVTKDGQAFFNGVALHDEAQRTLALGCERALRGD